MTSEDPVYQMLWNCPTCGAEGLLGLDHRYCPNCGTPQDPSKRYFPDDDQKVAVTDHRYHGADWICPGCETPNSAAATYCVSCGGDAQGSKQAKRIGETPPPAPVAEPSGGGVKKAAAAGGCLALGFVGFIVALLVFGAVAVFWSKPSEATVTGHRWERTIATERLSEVEDAAWCDALPKDSTELSRSMKEKSTEKVQDGETCVKKNKDLGDGTFKQLDECSPKFKEVPVEAPWCRYKTNRWEAEKSARAAGDGLSPAPSWPAVSLTRPACTQVGCEREGARTERYEVLLKTKDNEVKPCDLNEKQWAAMAVGSAWKVDLTLTGGLKCNTLAPMSK